MTGTDPATRWAKVAILVFSGYVLAFHGGKVPAAIPALRDTFGFDLLVAGLIVAALNLMSALAGVFIGALTDRLGYRRMALAGLVIVGTASILGGLATNAEQVLFTRFAESLGFILGIVAIPALIVDHCRPDDRTKALGYWGTYMPGGTAMMILLSPVLLAAFGWRGSWLINGAAALAWAAIFWLTIDPPARRAGGAERRGDFWRDLARVVTSPGPIFLSLCFAGYAGMFLAVTAFLPTLLVEEGGLTLASASVLSGIVVAANATGNIASGWLMSWRIPRPYLLIGAAVVMFASTIVVYRAGLPIELRYGMAIVFSAVGGLIPGSLLSGVPNYAPSAALVGSSVGLVTQGAGIGQVIGPPMLAAVVEGGGGWHAAPIFTLGAVLLSAFSAVGLLWLRSRRGSGGV